MEDNIFDTSNSIKVLIGHYVSLLANKWLFIHIYLSGFLSVFYFCCLNRKLFTALAGCYLAKSRGNCWLESGKLVQKTAQAG